jgi:hypothetical protein
MFLSHCHDTKLLDIPPTAWNTRLRDEDDFHAKTHVRKNSKSKCRPKVKISYA